jgi:NAD(P)H-flavin reductase
MHRRSFPTSRTYCIRSAGSLPDLRALGPSRCAAKLPEQGELYEITSHLESRGVPRRSADRLREFPGACVDPARLTSPGTKHVSHLCDVHKIGNKKNEAFCIFVTTHRRPLVSPSDCFPMGACKTSNVTMKWISLLAAVLFHWSALNHVASFTTPQQPSVARRPAPALTTTPSYSQHYFSNARCDSLFRLYMAWGPEPIWNAAQITKISDACPSGKSVSLQLSVPSETAAAYTVPGQYVQVQPVVTSEDVKPAFLAICSGPSSEEGAATFDFLVKRTDANDWLTNVPAGTALQVSQVLGNGYNIAENVDGLKYDFPTQNVLLCAAGSGIAPIAAAIQSGLLQTTTRSCRLYYGERTAADLCFVDQFAAWENAGVEVVPVLSQPEPDWQGRAGYVQTALAEDGIAIPRNTAALLCGMKGMTESVKELLLAAGVFDGRVLFNF